MSITRRALIWVGMASVLMAGVGTSQAQIGYQAASLEWLVVDSDVVVRGKVVDVSPKQADRFDRVTVTLDVDETLKGRPKKRLKFVVYLSPSVKTFDELRDMGQAALFFLVRAERYPFKADVRGDGVDVATELELHEVSEWQWDQSIVRLGPPAAERRLTLPIFTADLTLLTRPDEVLRAARATAIEGGKAERARLHKVDLLYNVMRATGKSGDANILFIPSDSRLEAAARAWIRSSGDILRRLGIARPEGVNHRWSDTDWLRSEGVRALGYFKSDENAVILKSLLDDDAFTHRKIEEGEQAGITEKVYYIRKESFETLRRWGVQVNEPVLKELLPPSYNADDPPPVELGKFDPFIGEFEAHRESEVEYGGAKSGETIGVKRALGGWYIEWTISLTDQTTKRDIEQRMMICWDRKTQKYRLWKFLKDNPLEEVEGVARFEDGDLVLDSTWRSPDSLTAHIRTRCRMVSNDELRMVHEFQAGGAEYKKTSVTTGKRKSK